MIGRTPQECLQSTNVADQERYKRNIFDDMKVAIDIIRGCNDALMALHPDVIYKIRQII